MLKIDLTQTIPSIVETMLPKYSDPSLGLLITLDLRDNCYETNKSAATILYFLFQRPSNYTKVLVKYKFNEWLDCSSDPIYNETYYTKYSDHDSCWKSDGLKIFTEHYNNISTYFNEHPGKLSSFYSFSLHNAIKYVKFEKFEPVTQENDYIKGYNVSIREIINLQDVHNYLH